MSDLLSLIAYRSEGGARLRSVRLVGWLILLLGLLLPALSAPAAPVDVTRPGDPITASASDPPSPDNEGVANAIDDNVNTKYLNFNKLNTFIQVTPSAGPTVVTGIGITSANDFPVRDPASYLLEGSNDGGASFTEISRGAIPAFTARFQEQDVFISNTQSYAVYRITFPTVANAANANSIQLSELQLFAPTQYTVTNVNDDGEGSLRAALDANNATGGGGVVTFNLPSLPATITLNSELTVSRPVSVKGPGLDQVTVSGNDATRLIHLNGGSLVLDGLTLTHGKAPDGETGGAVLTDAGTGLTLQICAVSDSQANQGGGLDSRGPLTADHCTFSENTATFGGAVSLSDKTTILSSTFDRNHASSNGGGLYETAPGSLTLDGSTLSGNSALFGGGIDVGGGDLTLRNCTVFGNSAGSHGGGLGFGSNVQASFTNCTLVGNSSPEGGGIRNFGSVKMINTIVANSPSGGNCNGGVTSQGHNLSSDATCFDPGTTPSDNISTDPQLGPLQDNGGPTLTHAPLPGSPALDAGDPTNIGPTETDQRGFPRLFGPNPDIGAVEQQASYVVTNTNNDGEGSLRAAIDANNATAGGGVITFNLPSLPDTITLNSELAVSRLVSVIGPGSAKVTVSGNDSSRLLHLIGGSLVVDGLTLTHGKAPADENGGAILTDVGAGLTLRNCAVSHSRADEGGGIYQNGGNLTVTNTTFSDNTAGFFGGGIYILNGDADTVTNSTLSDNSATQEGGGLIQYGGNLKVTNSTLSGNSAKELGGGIKHDHGNLTVTNSTLSGNSSSNAGGAIYTYSGTLALTSSTLSGNSTNYGGGIFQYGGNVTVTNSTLSGNSAASLGGGIYISDPAGVTLHNTIVANSPSGGNCDGTVTSLGYNLDSDGACGLNNTGDRSGATANPLDPKLGPLQDNGGPTFTQAPLSGSPAINAGDTTGITTADTDQRGLPRIFGSNPDIGAVEQQASYVVTNTNDSGGGSLRAAIEANNATAGGGVITFNLPSLPDTITLNSELAVSRPASVIGPGSAKVTVSGNDAARIFHLTGGSLVVDGLTLTHGQAPKGEYGGAILADLDAVTGLTLRNCVVSNSHGAFGGGVIGNRDIAVIDSTFSNNSAIQTGGGLYSGGVVTVTNSTFSGNSASGYGGGISIDNGGAVRVTNSALWGNTAGAQGGGAIYDYYGTVTVTNSTFSGNSADSGGGIENFYGTATVTNSTFSGNSANAQAGGGGIRSFGSANLKNTLIADSPSGGNCRGDITSLGHNLSSDGTCGGGTGDLLHTDAKLGPLDDNGGPTLTHTLPPSSPAFNAGDATGITPTDTDQRGQPRISYGGVDIGAVEMTWMPGDLNGDGSVNASDVNILMSIFLGKRTATAGEIIVGDTRPKPGTNGQPYGDGSIGGDDLNWLLRRFLGLETTP